MSSAFANPGCKYDLTMISEELAWYPEETLHPRKHRAYIISLVNMDKVRRPKDFLREWAAEGPKAIGVPKGHRHATSLAKASELLATLITDASKNIRIYCIVRDLQVMATDKLLSSVDRYYLVTLKDVGANGLIQ